MAHQVEEACNWGTQKFHTSAQYGPSMCGKASDARGPALPRPWARIPAERQRGPRPASLGEKCCCRATAPAPGEGPEHPSSNRSLQTHRALCPQRLRSE
jgi:hypothetical protein